MASNAFRTGGGKKPCCRPRQTFSPGSVNLVQPFDALAAAWFGPVMVRRARLGLPIQGFDALIAAICRAHGAALATRNVKDFVETGIEIVDPWAAAG